MLIRSMSRGQFSREFPTGEAAEAWFVQRRWGDTISCPHDGCSSDDITGESPGRDPVGASSCVRWQSRPQNVTPRPSINNRRVEPQQTRLSLARLDP